MLIAFGTVPYKLWNRQLHEFGFTICPLQKTRASWSSALLLMPLFNYIMRAYIQKFLGNNSHWWDRLLWLPQIVKEQSKKSLNKSQAFCFVSISKTDDFGETAATNEPTDSVYLVEVSKSHLYSLFIIIGETFFNVRNVFHHYWHALLFFPSLPCNAIWFVKILQYSERNVFVFLSMIIAAEKGSHDAMEWWFEKQSAWLTCSSLLSGPNCIVKFVELAIS